MLPSSDAWASPYDEQTGTRTLPMAWDDALAAEAVKGAWIVESQEILMRRMMREECLFSTDRIYRALMVEGEHSVSLRFPDPGDNANPKDADRFARSQEALAFVQGFVDRLPYPLRSVCYDLLEADSYGNKLCEVELGDYELDDTAFVGTTWVAPVDVSPKPRTVYSYVVDASNRVVGVKPIASDALTIPASNLLWLTVGGMDRDPRGGGILPSLYRTWARKIRAEENQDKSADQTGGGFLQALQDYPPADIPYTSTIELPNPNYVPAVGNPTIPNPAYTSDNGQPLTIANPAYVPPVGSPKIDKSKERVVGEQVRKIKSGATAVMPPGTKLDPVQADGAAIFDAMLDRFDRAIVRAYLGAARSLLEAENGSKADSDTAADVGLTMRDACRGRLSGAIEAMFARVLALNFGDRYADVVPRYQITTAEGTDLLAVSTFFQFNFGSLTLDQKNWLMDKIGGPHFSEDDQAKAEAVQNSQQQAQNGQQQEQTPAVSFKRRVTTPKQDAQAA
jgi:hypothetical protein